MTDQQNAVWGTLQKTQLRPTFKWVVRHGYNVLVLSAGCREEILYLRNPEDCGYTTEHINALFIHTLLNHIMAAPFGVAILDAAKTWAEDFVENIRETDYWGIFCASAQACNKTVVDCDPSQY